MYLLLHSRNSLPLEMAGAGKCNRAGKEDTVHPWMVAGKWAREFSWVQQQPLLYLASVLP